MTHGRPTYRYAVEHSLIADCTYIAIASPARLPVLAESIPEIDRFHLYAIGRRPRVSIDPSSWSANEDEVALDFLADWGDGEPASASFTWPNIYGCVPALELNGPQSVAKLVGPRGEVLAEGPASHFMSSLLSSAPWDERRDFDANFLDLNVDYVGKAIGTPEQPRSAVERLANHETLQRILADSAANAPHLEVWLILLAFEDYTTIGAMGAWDSTASEEAESARLQGIYGREAMGLDAVVSVAEGSLIRYFQPSFNTQLKAHFPKSHHRSIAEPYVRDYGALGFQMETTAIGCRLKSEVVEPSFVHGPVFRMTNDADRQAFVDYWDDSDAPSGALLTTLRDRQAETLQSP